MKRYQKKFGITRLAMPKYIENMSME